MTTTHTPASLEAVRAIRADLALTTAKRDAAAREVALLNRATPNIRLSMRAMHSSRIRVAEEALRLASAELAVTIGVAETILAGV